MNLKPKLSSSQNSKSGVLLQNNSSLDVKIPENSLNQPENQIYGYTSRDFESEQSLKQKTRQLYGQFKTLKITHNRICVNLVT